MSRRIVFPTGYDNVLFRWVTGDFRFALMKDTWTQDESSQVFMADIVANEMTGGGYGRVVATTKSKAITLPATAGAVGTIGYLCDPPDFGAISGGEIATSLVLFEHITSDADSPLVAAYPCSYVANGSTDALFGLSAVGAVVASTVCPDGF